MPRPPLKGRDLSQAGRLLDLSLNHLAKIEFLAELLDDTNQRILSKLDQVLAKHEFDPFAPRGWDTLTEALADMAQKIDNNRGEIDKIKEKTDRLPIMEECCETIGPLLDDILDLARQLRPDRDEVTSQNGLSIAGSGCTSLLPQTVILRVDMNEIPDRITTYAGDLGRWKWLGEIIFTWNGRMYDPVNLRFEENWMHVPPAADGFCWRFQNDVVATAYEVVLQPLP